jgi:Alginate export
MIPILTGLTWATLTGDSQAQRLPIPDYQTREQPDDCSLAPSDYGPTTLLSFCDTEDDKAKIQQLYLDINFPSFDEGSFTLRLGRQELAYGIVRLIDPREGPNVRQSFDGAKAILHVEKWEIDGFATRLAETNTDRFYNPDPYAKFWGLYATPDLGFIPNAGIDLYYLGLRRNFAPFDSGLATKTRHTLGSRLHGTRGSAAYVGEETNLVGVWQINRHLTFTTSYSHFFAGDFAPEIPGSGSFNYVATWLTFKF